MERTVIGNAVTLGRRIRALSFYAHAWRASTFTFAKIRARSVFVNADVISTGIVVVVVITNDHSAGRGRRPLRVALNVPNHVISCGLQTWLGVHGFRISFIEQALQYKGRIERTDNLRTARRLCIRDACPPLQGIVEGI